MSLLSADEGWQVRRGETLQAIADTLNAGGFATARGWDFPPTPVYYTLERKKRQDASQ